MPRRNIRKWPNEKEEQSEMIDRVDEESVATSAEEFPLQPYVGERESHKHKCAKSFGSREVHFAMLPDKYEPLEEDTSSDAAMEERNRRKQEKYKRFRKNFGKALRYTWKCLVVGLQSFSTAYSWPLSAATTLVPEIQRTRPRA